MPKGAARSWEVISSAVGSSLLLSFVDGGGCCGCGSDDDCFSSFWSDVSSAGLGCVDVASSSSALFLSSAVVCAGVYSTVSSVYNS